VAVFETEWSNGQGPSNTRVIAAGMRTPLILVTSSSAKIQLEILVATKTEIFFMERLE